MEVDRPAGRGWRQQQLGGASVTKRMSGGLDYNAPLRGAGSAPSPFYKLSTELSRESLRAPGAIPFQWEQTPGRRKSGAGAATGSTGWPCGPPAAPVPAPPRHHDAPPEKPSLASLFRQGSLRYSIPAPPADHRSASARFLPSHSARRPPPPPQAPRDDGCDEGAASEAAFTAVSAASDVFTAAAGLSVDGSLAAASGPGAPAAAPPDDRHLIMYRFLPAAHAIACDSPQTPSRRHTPTHTHMAATEAAAGATRQLLVRPSPLRYSSTSAAATPSRMPKRRPPSSPLGGDDHGDDEDDDESTAGNDYPPPASMKACGMFSFRFRAAFMDLCSRVSPCSTPPSSSSNSRFRKKPTTSKKKSDHPATSNNYTISRPTRLADILKESDDNLADWVTSVDDASSYTDASSRFSPVAHPYSTSDHYNSSCRGSTLTGAMSPFIEGKGFLGMPHEHHRHRLNAQLSDRYATPRSSNAGETSYYRAEEIVLDNGRLQFQKETVTSMNDQLPLNLQHSIGDHADYPADNGNNPKGVDDDQSIRGRHDSTATVPIPVITEGTVESTNQCSTAPKMINGSVNMMLSPPLPKSPSESWLWKAMASPAKAGFSPHSKRMELPGSPTNGLPPRHHGPKWENIVKGSHVQPGHLRFSEELLHQSKNSIKVGGI